MLDHVEHARLLATLSSTMSPLVGADGSVWNRDEKRWIHRDAVAYRVEYHHWRDDEEKARAKDPNFEFDPIFSAPSKDRYFPTRAAALRYARKVARSGLGPFNVARLHEVRQEYVGRSTYQWTDDGKEGEEICG